MFANFPTANVQVAKGLQSPLTKEFTLALGRELGQQGHAKATYVRRHTSNFVEDFVSLANGIVNVPLVGQLTNRVLDNTNVPKRSYEAAIFQTDYRMADRLMAGGDYTLQIKDNGNFAGEAAGQPGIQSPYGDFPEILGPALDRLMPEGRLDSFQRHKLRVYGIYSQSLGRSGSLDLSPIWRVNSGRVYSLTAGLAIPAAQLARNPGIRRTTSARAFVRPSSSATAARISSRATASSTSRRPTRFRCGARRRPGSRSRSTTR